MRAGIDNARGRSITGEKSGRKLGKSQAPRSRPKSRVPHELYYILLAAVILFFAVIRFRLRDIPLERDEGEYAYAGQLILQGIPPYALAYNMKLPGTYLAYSSIMLVFGESATGIHVGLLLENALTTVLLFFLGRRLFGAGVALVAAITYLLLSTSPSVLGFAGHATHFVVLAALAGIFLLSDTPNVLAPWKACCAGALLGLAFLMKQPGIFFVLFGVVWLLFLSWRSKLARHQFVLRLVLFGIGAAGPFALICFWMWKAGVFSHFWFWTFTMRALTAPPPVCVRRRLCFGTSLPRLFTPPCRSGFLRSQALPS